MAVGLSRLDGGASASHFGLERVGSVPRALSMTAWARQAREVVIVYVI